MDTVIVIALDDPGGSPQAQALRAAGLRVVPHRLSDEIDQALAARPQLVLIDVPDDRRVRPLLEPLLVMPESDAVPIVAIVGGDGIAEAAMLAELADFVVRPCTDAELVARVRRRVLLSRGRTPEERLCIAGLVVDLKGYEASIDGERLDLTYQEFELLKFLASHPNQAFSRDQLLARVWGYDYYGGSRTVDIHVRRIRAKLGNPYARCIRTIRNVGYKWTPETEAT